VSESEGLGTSAVREPMQPGEPSHNAAGPRNGVPLAHCERVAALFLTFAVITAALGVLYLRGADGPLLRCTPGDYGRAPGPPPAPLWWPSCCSSPLVFAS